MTEVVSSPAAVELPEAVRKLGDPRRYAYRFVVCYTLLALAAAGAIAAFVLLLVGPGYRSPAPWSEWRPSRSSPAATVQAIARHVAREYRLAEAGAQLVAIASKVPPVVTNGVKKLAVSTIAERRGGAIRMFDGAASVQYGLCAAGPLCALPPVEPAAGLVRLIRREALELALYTFRFLPKTQTVVVFLPPAVDAPPNMLLFFERSTLARQLQQPLNETLPLRQPPLPRDADPTEATAIDRLTVPALHAYHVSELPSGGAALVLDPPA
jgi:hypothetical protein